MIWYMCGFRFPLVSRHRCRSTLGLYGSTNKTSNTLIYPVNQLILSRPEKVVVVACRKRSSKWKYLFVWFKILSWFHAGCHFMVAKCFWNKRWFWHGYKGMYLQIKKLQSPSFPQRPINESPPQWRPLQSFPSRSTGRWRHPGVTLGISNLLDGKNPSWPWPSELPPSELPPSIKGQWWLMTP